MGNQGLGWFEPSCPMWVPCGSLVGPVWALAGIFALLPYCSLVALWAGTRYRIQQHGVG